MVCDTMLPLKYEEQQCLQLYFEEGHRQIETFPEYWVHGWDESLSFCLECCEKQVAELLQGEPGAEYCIYGGWGGECDSTPFCDSCQKMLQGYLTKYGAEEELSHFEQYGFHYGNDDRRAMWEVVESIGWRPANEWIAWRKWRQVPIESSELHVRLHQLCRPILDRVRDWEYILAQQNGCMK